MSLIQLRRGNGWLWLLSRWRLFGRGGRQIEGMAKSLSGAWATPQAPGGHQPYSDPAIHCGGHSPDKEFYFNNALRGSLARYAIEIDYGGTCVVDIREAPLGTEGRGNF
jgi:hypothetical protein